MSSANHMLVENIFSISVFTPPTFSHVLMLEMYIFVYVYIFVPY